MSTRSAIEEIAARLCVTAGDSYALDGREVALPARLARLTDRPPLWQRGVSALLARVVYQAFYLRQAWDPEAAQRPRGATPADGREHPVFGALLRRADAGTGHVEPGWWVTAAAGQGTWRVSNGSVTLVARGDQLLDAGGGLLPGSQVGVRLPSGRPHRSPGFYLTVSDAGPPRAGAPATRVYVHVTAAGAAVAVRRLTSLLNDSGIPAVVKVVNHPARFERPDALVVYLERSEFVRRAAELSIALATLALEPSTPGFTKPWLPGVGLADDPRAAGAPVRSFGEHRCRIVAAGLVAAYAASPCSDPVDPAYGRERREHVERAVRDAALDPDRLYLEPGADDCYPEYDGGRTPAP